MESPVHHLHHKHSVDRIVQLEAEVANLIAASQHSQALLDELHDEAAVREERLERARYQALEEAERAELLANELESIFKQMPLALIVVNHDGVILRANTAADVLLAWPIDNMLAGSLEILCFNDLAVTNVVPITAEFGDDLDEPSVFALCAADNHSRRAVLRGSDGLERIVDLFATEVMTAHGSGYLLVLEALADAQTLSV